MNYYKMEMHINVIVQVRKLKNKKIELNKKNFLISIIENGEMQMKKTFRKILNL